MASDEIKITVESNLDTGGSATREIRAPITTESGVDHGGKPPRHVRLPPPPPPSPPNPQRSSQSQHLLEFPHTPSHPLHSNERTTPITTKSGVDPSPASPAKSSRPPPPPPKLSSRSQRVNLRSPPPPQHSDEIINSTTAYLLASAKAALHPTSRRPQHDYHEEDCSIHRVPHRLGAEKKPTAYEPNVISIGPYHYGIKHLQPMEVMKRSCFAKIVKTRDLEYGEFARSMIVLKDRVRECYQGPIHPDLDEKFDEFIGMMIYDGCFIVGLIRDGYPEDVCKLGRHIQIEIQYDMLLLENQLPFFLLDKLDEIMTKKTTRSQTDLSTAALSFFRKDEGGPQIWFCRGIRPSSKEEKPSSNEQDVAEQNGQGNKQHVDHLLDLLYKCCIPSTKGIQKHGNYLKKHEAEGSQRSWKFIRSATGLYDAGIDFSGKKVLRDQKKVSQDQGLQVEVRVLQDQDREGQGLQVDQPVQVLQDDQDQGLLDIEFKEGLIPNIIPIRNNVLEIPTLVVYHNTERMLRNLLAYEQFNKTEAKTYVYDYVMFMDNLIDTGEDVQLLCKKGVIDNWLGDDDSVAQMFNKLRDSVYSSKDFYYAETFNKVNKHCNKKLIKRMVILRKEYFNSTWSCCAFAAAFILLVGTVLQTVYAFITYYHKSKG